VRDLAKRFKSLLVDRLGGRLLDVRVFGSVAQGEATEGSDLDVFVLVDRLDPAARRTVYDAAWEAGDEVGAPLLISPLVMGRAHYEELLRREILIAQDIQREGVPV